MLRSALLILSGNAATSAFLFARNILVATLIPVADYGVAATFALAMAAVEMASTLGLQQQIVQARDGDDPRLQHTLQAFQLVRGVFAGLVLFAVAGPLAAFLGIPQVAWAYQVLALVPVLTALQHFDIHRLNRQARFLPLVLTGAVPALGSLLLIWPLAAWLGDWRVMLWAILFQAAAAMILSHWVSDRPYRLLIDLPIWRRSLSFGWPLLLNAVILFGVFQGDKLLVARLLSMEVFAVFAMATTLTLTPSMVLARTVQTTFLARLSKANETGTAAPLGQACITTALTLGLALAVLGGLLTPALRPLLAETGYATLPTLLVPMAILQGLRMSKAGSGVVALSHGFTANAMVANLPRLLALFVAWVALTNGYGLLTLVWIGAAAEAAGLVLSLTLLRQRAGAKVTPPMAELAIFGVGIIALTLGDRLSSPHGLAAGLLAIIALAAALQRRISRAKNA